MKSPSENGFDRGSTSSTLLRRVRKLDDRPAWEAFVRFYSPLLQQSCRGLRLDPETADEVCQRVWVELMRVMPTFTYNRGFGFRLWLKRLCRNRAIDLIRERDRERKRLLSIETTGDVEDRVSPPDEPDPATSELAR